MNDRESRVGEFNRRKKVFTSILSMNELEGNYPIVENEK